MEQNRKSQKLFPFVKVLEKKHGDVPIHLKAFEKDEF